MMKISALLLLLLVSCAPVSAPPEAFTQCVKAGGFPSQTIVGGCSTFVCVKPPEAK
jgi:hypothetical protein